MSTIIAEKLNMEQIFSAKDGSASGGKDVKVIPVTSISVQNKENLEKFKEGDLIKISGISKGKGFQGVVKRHKFGGAPKSHGTKHALRQAGSIGATWPQRVIKGKKMPGRMGGERVTVKNLKVVQIDKEKGLLFVKGAIPGHRGTKLEIRL